MANRKEYIERGALIKKLNDKSINAQTVFINTVLKGLLYQAPVADVVEVVRCSQCKHWYQGDCYRLELSRPDDYCSYGERKDGADNAADI